MELEILTTTTGAVLAVVSSVVGFFLAARSERARLAATDAKVALAEQNVAANPEKPQAAWELARRTLESYLERNLSHLRSIFRLTIVVMTAGFVLVVYGLAQAIYGRNADYVTIASSTSGVLITFIGGSFLLVYRSVLAQSKDYVTVLERINAVGMAVQVIATIDDSDGNLRRKTTAALASQLLQMYSPERASAARVRRPSVR